jgi:photosystem II stability/assembly factor-like uncharacterized protein
VKAPRERSPAKVGTRQDRSAARAGGKALLRLRFFEHQRELEERAVVPKAPARPLVARGARRPAGAAGAEPTSPYADAFEAVHEEATDAAAATTPPVWRPLGPFSIPHGQTYGWGPGSRPSVAGRISSVAVDPSDPAHVLIGAGGGGIWETRDGGKTWEPRADDKPSLAIGAIAFDPSNPAIVYAGTGEGDFFSRLGVGLLRSTNGGRTWQVRARGAFVGSGFFDLVVDPLNGNHVLAATELAVYESVNGGSTFRRRRNMWAWDLSMHPAVPGDADSTKEVFAACADGLFRSTDGGTTWRRVALPNAPSYWERLEVCHCPADGDVVYAFGAGGGGAARLYRRSTFGGAFTRIAPPGALETAQAWYDWFAATAPNNPDVLYLGAIEVHKGVRGATGRWSWSTISARGSGESIHPDQHAIAFSPANPSVVYIGNDGGLYRSPDAGRNWESLNKGLCITEFEFLAQHRRHDAFLVGGTQDNGTLRYEGEDAWYHVQDGDGGDCGFGETDPPTCFHTFWGMGMERSRQGGRWGSWTWVGPDPPYSYAALFYPPVEVNGRVVAQAGASVYVSLDEGRRWTNVRFPATAGVATALAIPTPRRIYVGTDSGRIFRLDRSGRRWTVHALRRPRYGYVSDIAVDPREPARLWATYSDVFGAHVFRSGDGGTSWQNVSSNLPEIPVNAIEVDPNDSDTVWIAADVGVHRSTDGGASWAPFGTGLPNALAKDILLHRETRLLRVATQSRGVWEINADGSPSPDARVYVRESAIDTGRATAPPTAIDDPFAPGATIHWWQSPDVKVDAPPFERPALEAVDFKIFDDDHGIAYSGLVHENPQLARTARVYVQVHNRGATDASGVALRVFRTSAGVGLPDLPPGFWTGFPANSVPARSRWKPVGPHKVVPNIEPGRSEVVGFEWPVPAGGFPYASLLVIVTAANDAITTTERRVADLVRSERRCAVKSVAIVNPVPEAGARVRSVVLDLTASAASATYTIGGDRRGTSVPRAIVLSKPLARRAREAGLAKVTLTNDEKAELRRLTRRSRVLRDRLNVNVAFAPPKKREWLEDVPLRRDRAEPLVVLVNPRARAGRWSILQQREDGYLAGGFTLAVRRE